MESSHKTVQSLAREIQNLVFTQSKFEKKVYEIPELISAPMYLHPHRPKMIWHQLGENKNFKITFKNYEIATNNFSQIMTMRHHQLHVHQ